MYTGFDRVVAQMMRNFGTQAIIRTASGTYDPSNSNNDVVSNDIQVNVIAVDYLRKEDGSGAERNTLIQSGDKQVYVQPTHKADFAAAPLAINPTRDVLIMGGTTYKIVFLKKIDTGLSNASCVLYELYARS